jgi:hypothetical protein
MRVLMADLAYYKAKIAECLRLVESSNDPLYRDVYQAMADEFAEKHAALSRKIADAGAPPPSPPPSPLLHQVNAPAVQPDGSEPAGVGGVAGRQPGRGPGHEPDRRRRKRGPSMMLRPV